MSARRHHSASRRRPRRDELAGADDARVTAPAVELDLALRARKLSDMPLTRVKESKPGPEFAGPGHVVE